MSFKGLKVDGCCRLEDFEHNFTMPKARTPANLKDIHPTMSFNTQSYFVRIDVCRHLEWKK